MSESKINLPRLKELDAKATKGPWDFESPSGEPANCLCMTDEDAEGITLDCESEPDIDAPDWEFWLDSHSDMPYVHMLPLEQKVIKWINQNFRFKID